MDLVKETKVLGIGLPWRRSPFLAIQHVPIGHPFLQLHQFINCLTFHPSRPVLSQHRIIWRVRYPPLTTRQIFIAEGERIHLIEDFVHEWVELAGKGERKRDGATLTLNRASHLHTGEPHGSVAAAASDTA